MGLRSGSVSWNYAEVTLSLHGYVQGVSLTLKSEWGLSIWDRPFLPGRD